MAYFGDIIVKKSGSCLRFSLVSSTPLGYKHPCCPLSLRENLWRSQSSICLDANSQGTDNSDNVISLKWLWLINKERSYFFPNNFYDKKKNSDESKPNAKRPGQNPQVETQAIRQKSCHCLSRKSRVITWKSVFWTFLWQYIYCPVDCVVASPTLTRIRFPTSTEKLLKTWK